MSAVKQDTDNGVRHAIEVRGLDNRFGTQQVHQDLGKVCKTFLPDCRDGTIAT